MQAYTFSPGFLRSPEQGTVQKRGMPGRLLHYSSREEPGAEQSAWSIPLGVQVPNNHVLYDIQAYETSILNPSAEVLGMLDL